MHTKLEDTLWLDARQHVSLTLLAELSGLPEAELHELVDSGVLAPVESPAGPTMFSVDCVVTVRKARRLRDELELDTHALAVALKLLQQIAALETELRELRARLPRYSC